MVNEVQNDVSSNDPFVDMDYNNDIYLISNNEIYDDPVIQDWLNNQILKYGTFIDFNSLNVNFNYLII